MTSTTSYRLFFCANGSPGKTKTEHPFGGPEVPEEYGVTPEPLPPESLAKNDIGFHDLSGVDHDAPGGALKKAIYNDMLDIGLEEDVRSWFPFKVPKTTVQRNRIERALQQRG